MKKSSRPKHNRGKAPADEVVEILFHENACGVVFVTMPNGEVLMVEPDPEDAYHHETVLAGKLAGAVAREVVAETKRLGDLPASSGAGKPSTPEISLTKPTRNGSQPPRKRGRPPEIPQERKRRALAVQGARARAEILYATRYPTPQQKKNVSSIMRHFLKKEI